MRKPRKKTVKALRKKARHLLQNCASDFIIGLVTGVITNLITDQLSKPKSDKPAAGS